MVCFLNTAPAPRATHGVSSGQLPKPTQPRTSFNLDSTDRLALAPPNILGSFVFFFWVMSFQRVRLRKGHRGEAMPTWKFYKARNRTNQAHNVTSPAAVSEYVTSKI